METYVWTSDDGLGDCVVVVGKDVVVGVGRSEGSFWRCPGNRKFNKTPKKDRHRTKCPAIIDLDNVP